MLAAMALLLDSFWRALAYCFHRRVIALSALPLVLMAVLALGWGYFYWDASVASARALLEAQGWLGTVWGWLQDWGLGNAPAFVAPLLVVAVLTPVVVLIALLLVAVFMAPALVALVAQRRFAGLERKKGGSLWASLAWSLGSTLLAVVALLVSMPLWLIPPLVLLLPPLIWGWLTYRVMAFDALAEHASKEERQMIFFRHRMALLLIGVCSGYLGAAPALVWASGMVFAAGFVVLIPLGIWIYTLVFAFSSLWFAHFCMAALQALRAENAVLSATPLIDSPAPEGLLP